MHRLFASGKGGPFVPPSKQRRRAAEGGGEAQESYESEKGGDRELVRDLTKVLHFLKKSVFDTPFIYSFTEEFRYFETLTSLQ